MRYLIAFLGLFSTVLAAHDRLPTTTHGRAASAAPEGRVLTYFPDGHLATERYYHLGREVGTHRGWYDDGTPRFEYQYVNGISEGAAYEWNAAGHLIRESHYLHGREEGSQRLWDDTGRLRANYVMRDGIRYGRLGALGCEGAKAAVAAP